MTIIGVDSSGHVKQPPIYMMAVRITKNKGQLDTLLHVSPQQHEEYVGLANKMRISHWFEKISAILIFKVVCEVYYAHDSINIDVDFQGKSRRYVKEWLKRLFQAKFLGDSKRNNPSITFVPAAIDDDVRCADLKSKKARHKRIEVNKKIDNPNIIDELCLFQ